MNLYLSLLFVLSFAGGFSSFSLSFFLYLKYKKKIILLYLLTLGIWSLHFLFVKVFGILQQLSVINNIDFEYNLEVISYILWGLLSFLLIYSSTIISHKKISIKKIVIYGTVCLFIALPFKYFNHNASVIVDYLKHIFHAVILFRCIFLLSKIQGSRLGKKPRKIYKVFIRVLMFSFPLLILEILPILSNYFPLGIGLYALFYLSINLLIQSFISQFIYMPKLEYSKEDNNSDRSQFLLYSLTKREIDISKSILNGDSYRTISEEKNISLETVKTHVNNIYRKVQVTNKVELIKSLTKN